MTVLIHGHEPLVAELPLMLAAAPLSFLSFLTAEGLEDTNPVRVSGYFR